MNQREKESGRNTLMAVFLALAMPGLGQIYNGELIKGMSFFVSILAVSIFGARWSVLLPDGMLMYGVLATFLASLALNVYAIVDAFNDASKSKGYDPLKRYNHWYFYLAAWLAGRLVFGAVYGYITGDYIQPYKIPTQSMQPEVMQGDNVLADKTAYKRMAPKKGDVVIFVYPDDRSKKFIRRIEGLPGDIITGPDGTKKEVPHGYVYVLGDNMGNSYDSRQFGFVPLSDVIAKVRQIYYSSGKNGIRWDRIGTAVVSG
jgi:signal peptidase I